MSITHTTAVRNALAEVVKTAADAGTGPAQLVFMTAGEVEVATLTMSDPAFGTVSSGTITAGAIMPDTDATGNASPIALFKIQDSDANEIIRGSATVTGGDGDIELSSLVISPGDTVEVSSFSYTASL